MTLLAAEAAGNEGGAGGDGERNRVHGRLDISEWRALGLHAHLAGRRSLTRGQPVDLVVHREIQEIHVAAHGVNKVVAADPEAVAVAAGYGHRELVIGEFDARGDCQGSAMKRVHAARTPKSPHPGHQSGSTFPLRSGRATCFKGAVVAMICSS